MAFCSQCGQQIVDGSAFCRNCGYQQVQNSGQPVALPAQPRENYFADRSGFSSINELPQFQAFAKKKQRQSWIFLGILAILALAAILIFVKEDLGMIVFVWAFVIAVTALISLFSGLASRKSWEGQLIDKRIVIKRTRDDDTNRTQTRRIPTLFFQTTAGKKVKIETGYRAGAFEYYEVGCHVRKHPRFSLPEKYEKGSENICVYCGTIFDRNLNDCPKCKLIALK